MKKSKLSITLVTSFIAAMALSACSDVTSSKTAIVTFTPYGSKESIDLITDDIYKEYSKTSAGVSKFYDKILEVLIRYEFKEKKFDKGELKYAEIETWAKNQVQEQKDKAKANAKSNGTNYDDEWESILESNNVESTKELTEKFIYEKEKEVIKNWYADNTDNAEALKNEFIGLDKDGNLVNSDPEKSVKSAFPYHIRHILVKVDEASESSEKFYKGTINESQAKLLYNTVSTLASGRYNFAQVASMYSEDGSASSGGDVGIMTNAATSGSLGMVSEFQLGLYAYDNLYDETRKADSVVATIKDELGFDSIVDEQNNKTAEEVLPASAVEVPYEAFVKIGKYADVTADKFGNKLANGSSTVYPRNVLWNKYLNLHNVFVIKKAKTGAPTFDSDPVNNPVANPNAEFSALAGAEYNDASISASRFNANGYLVDEKGNVIIGVRSEYGIHFMVIEKSMHEVASLSDYYTTKLPSDSDYPKGADGKPSKDTYVSYIESQSNEDYKKRADDVKSKITSFDTTYDYRLYQWLNTEVAITFTDAAKGLDQKIDAYINNQRKSNNVKQEEGLTKVWKRYTRMLARQDEDRNVCNWVTTNPVDASKSPKLTRLASEQIALDFYALYTQVKDEAANTPYSEVELKALYEKFAEGGDYYYYA